MLGNEQYYDEARPIAVKSASISSLESPSRETEGIEKGYAIMTDAQSLTRDFAEKCFSFGDASGLQSDDDCVLPVDIEGLFHLFCWILEMNDRLSRIFESLK